MEPGRTCTRHWAESNRRSQWDTVTTSQLTKTRSEDQSDTDSSEDTTSRDNYRHYCPPMSSADNPHLSTDTDSTDISRCSSTSLQLRCSSASSESSPEFRSASEDSVDVSGGNTPSSEFKSIGSASSFSNSDGVEDPWCDWTDPGATDGSPATSSSRSGEFMSYSDKSLGFPSMDIADDIHANARESDSIDQQIHIDETSKTNVQLTLTFSNEIDQASEVCSELSLGQCTTMDESSTFDSSPCSTDVSASSSRGRWMDCPANIPSLKSRTDGVTHCPTDTSETDNACFSSFSTGEADITRSDALDTVEDAIDLICFSCSDVNTSDKAEGHANEDNFSLAESSCSISDESASSDHGLLQTCSSVGSLDSMRPGPTSNTTIPSEFQLEKEKKGITNQEEYGASATASTISLDSFLSVACGSPEFFTPETTASLGSLSVYKTSSLDENSDFDSVVPKDSKSVRYQSLDHRANISIKEQKLSPEVHGDGMHNPASDCPLLIESKDVGNFMDSGESNDPHVTFKDATDTDCVSYKEVVLDSRPVAVCTVTGQVNPAGMSSVSPVPDWQQCQLWSESLMSSDEGFVSNPSDPETTSSHEFQDVPKDAWKRGTKTGMSMEYKQIDGSLEFGCDKDVLLPHLSLSGGFLSSVRPCEIRHTNLDDVIASLTKNAISQAVDELVMEHMHQQKHDLPAVPDKQLQNTSHHTQQETKSCRRISNLISKFEAGSMAKPRARNTTSQRSGDTPITTADTNDSLSSTIDVDRKFEPPSRNVKTVVANQKTKCDKVDSKTEKVKRLLPVVQAQIDSDASENHQQEIDSDLIESELVRQVSEAPCENSDNRPTTSSSRIIAVRSTNSFELHEIGSTTVYSSFERLMPDVDQLGDIYVTENDCDSSNMTKCHQKTISQDPCSKERKGKTGGKKKLKTLKRKKETSVEYGIFIWSPSGNNIAQCFPAPSEYAIYANSFKDPKDTYKEQTTRKTNRQEQSDIPVCGTGSSAITLDRTFSNSVADYTRDVISSALSGVIAESNSEHMTQTKQNKNSNFPLFKQTQNVAYTNCSGLSPSACKDSGTRKILSIESDIVDHKDNAQASPEYEYDNEFFHNGRITGDSDISSSRLSQKRSQTDGNGCRNGKSYREMTSPNERKPLSDQRLCQDIGHSFVHPRDENTLVASLSELMIDRKTMENEKETEGNFASQFYSPKIRCSLCKHH